MKNDIEQIEQFLIKYGKKGKDALEVIKKQGDYFRAVLESEFGSLVLNDDIQRCSELMEKSWGMELDIDEKAELRYLKRRIDTLARQYQTHLTLRKETIERMQTVA